MPTARQGYFLKSGQQVPGTTTVMQAISMGSSDALIYWGIKLAKEGLDPKTERQRAADVGTFIHDALEHFPDAMPARPLWMTNDEWERAQAAYRNYAEWDEAVRPEVLHDEVQLTSEQYGFGGCFDRLARIGTDIVLIDHKTGKTADPKKWAIQLGAYRQLITENKLVAGPIKRAVVLHYPLKKFRPVEISDEQLTAGFDLFQTALKAYGQIQRFPS